MDVSRQGTRALAVKAVPSLVPPRFVSLFQSIDRMDFTRIPTPFPRRKRVPVAILIALMACGPAIAAGDPGSDGRLQVPRFVSLKADRVNVRGGPTKDHDVAWIFTRAGLPVEITAEFET